jgi:hypothetical protein
MGKLLWNSGGQSSILKEPESPHKPQYPPEVTGSGRIRLVRKTFELQDPLALEQLCRLAPDRQQREEMFTIAHTA